jgi:hypothetical protein
MEPGRLNQVATAKLAANVQPLVPWSEPLWNAKRGGKTNDDGTVWHNAGPMNARHLSFRELLLEYVWGDWLANRAPDWFRVPIWNWLTGSDIDWRTMKPRVK